MSFAYGIRCHGLLWTDCGRDAPDASGKRSNEMTNALGQVNHVVAGKEPTAQTRPGANGFAPSPTAAPNPRSCNEHEVPPNRAKPMKGYNTPGGKN